MILPAFAGQVLELAAAGQPLTRDLAARATVYLRARTQYGIVDPADLTGLRRAVACGARRARPRARSTTCTRASMWIADGELERLDEARPRVPARSSASPTRQRAPAERRPGGSGEGGGDADPGAGDGPDAGDGP